MPWPDEYDDWTAPAPTAPRNNLSSTIETIYTALEIIQHQLGIDPAGASATVAARLDALETLVSEGLTDEAAARSTAMSEHVDADEPHPGKVGKIVTPLQPDGGGTMYSGGSPSATGEDFSPWIDTVG